jgi:hypothetical protein
MKTWQSVLIIKANAMNNGKAIFYSGRFCVSASTKITSRS